MLRGLTYFWRLHLAVLLGAATCAAVLTGALLVGDSVRGSLIDLTLDRLGRVDLALTSVRFVREALATDLENNDESYSTVVPVIILRGTAIQADSLARASGVTVLGVDRRFATLFPDAEEARQALVNFEKEPGNPSPPLIINAALQKELGAKVGDPVLLSFTRAADIPSATLMGRRDSDDVVATTRCVLRRVIPDRGPGRFSLSPHQNFPLVAFLPLVDLQRTLGRENRVNTILAAAGPDSSDDPDEALRRAIRLEDLLAEETDHAETLERLGR